MSLGIGCGRLGATGCGLDARNSSVPREASGL